MATRINTLQILDESIARADLNATVTGRAVIKKIIQGANVSLSSTGVDSGTGDVTINVTSFPWTGVTGKPTTLTGYGITDAQLAKLGGSTPTGGAPTLVASAVKSGKPLYTDPEFAVGVNGVAAYNNAGGGAVTATRVAEPTAPNISKFVMKIEKNTSVASPSLGGFYQPIVANVNRAYAQVFVAKIPVGYTLYGTGNAVGTGGRVNDWATPTEGTGLWETYVRLVYSGEGAPYSAAGHVYLGGPEGAVTWYIAYCNVFDISLDGATSIADAQIAAVNFSKVTGKPTTIAGYGVTDAYTKTQIDASLALKSNTTHTHAFSELTSKPTTLTGYGITDALSTVTGGTVNGSLAMGGNGNHLVLGGPLNHFFFLTNGDLDYAMRYSGGGTEFDGQAPDGPAFSGRGGGLFGTRQGSAGTAQWQLKWSTTGVDIRGNLSVGGFNALTTNTGYIKSEIDTALAGKSNVGHTHDFSALTAKPTTLGGYGITDSYTKSEVDTIASGKLSTSGGYIEGNLSLSDTSNYKSFSLGAGTNFFYFKEAGNDDYMMRHAGVGSEFDGQAVDGPAFAGRGGGLLGTRQGSGATASWQLKWTTTGVDIKNALTVGGLNVLTEGTGYTKTQIQTTFASVNNPEFTGLPKFSSGLKVTGGGIDFLTNSGDANLYIDATTGMLNIDAGQGVAFNTFSLSFDNTSEISFGGASVSTQNNSLVQNWNSDMLDGFHSEDFARTAHVHSFDSLSNKPTTLNGYGITDGFSTTGSNTVPVGDINLTNGSVNFKIPSGTGAWARGSNFLSSAGVRLGGAGYYGVGTVPSNIYLGAGDTPWISKNLSIDVTTGNATFTNNLTVNGVIKQGAINVSLEGHTQPFSSLTSLPSTLAGYGITDSYTSQAVQSRGMNLVTNGTGLLGTNYNFSTFTFYPQDTYVGGGSFMTAIPSAVLVNDELIPVIPDNFYKLKMYLKSVDMQINNVAYGMVVCYDVDGLPIVPSQYTYYDNVTTLAQPLKKGDTVVYLTSAANWTLGANTNRYIKIHRYTNGKGYTWPEKTYSRNTNGNNSFLDSGVNTTANTVTLTTAWPLDNLEAADKAWPVGTPISTCFSAGTYLYPTNIGNTPIPEVWTLAEGTFGSLSKDGNATSSKFPQGTAFIRIGALLNRMQNASAPTTANKTLVSGVYLTEIVPENITSGVPVLTGIQDINGVQLTFNKGLLTSRVGSLINIADAQISNMSWTKILSKPTTLAGYGITDASLNTHTHTFASLTSRPTTIAGYGLTDVYTKTQVDTSLAGKLNTTGGTVTGPIVMGGAGSGAHLSMGTGVNYFFLRGQDDFDYAMRYSGVGTAFDSIEPDGPAFTGKGGGLFGTRQGSGATASWQLRWDTTGVATKYKLDVGTNLNVLGTATVGGYTVLTTNSSIPLNKVSVTGTPTASTFLRGDGSWAEPPASGSASIDRLARFYTANECLTSNNSTEWNTLANGAGVSMGTYTPPALPGVLGNIRMSTGTQADSWGSIGNMRDSFNLGIGSAKFRGIVSLPNLSTNAQGFLIRLGLMDRDSGDSKSGAYFRYTDGINSGKWQAIVRNNFTETSYDTGIAGSTNTLRKFEISTIPNGTVTFKIGGVTVATGMFTSTAYGTETGYGVSFGKMTGTVPTEVLDVDFMDMEYILTTSR